MSNDFLFFCVTGMLYNLCARGRNSWWSGWKVFSEFWRGWSSIDYLWSIDHPLSNVINHRGLNTYSQFLKGIYQLVVSLMYTSNVLNDLIIHLHLYINLCIQFSYVGVCHNGMDLRAAANAPGSSRNAGDANTGNRSLYCSTCKVAHKMPRK